MQTEVMKLLHIQYPILQGGMANIAEHNLVAAVSNAGGLGLIAAGGSNEMADWGRIQIPTASR